MIQRHVFVTGRVQGVFFRATTEREASQFPDLRGYVRNLEDGRVEAVFVGAEESVLAMVKWCRKGPPMARVDHLQVLEESVDEQWRLNPGFGVLR